MRKALSTAYAKLWLPEVGGFVWFVVLASVLLLFLAWKLPTDPDLFWHVRAGSDVLARGIPHVDWYSHTMANFPWVDHEWLVEVPMAWLHQLGGMRLVSIVFALVVAGELVVGTRWWLRKLSWPWLLASTCVVVWLSSGFLGARPQMLTYGLLLLLLGLLARLRSNPRVVWLLPALLLVWTNLHGSFVLGLGVLGTWLAAEVMLQLLPSLNLGTPLGWRPLGRLVAASLLAVAATFATPYLHGVWIEALRTLRDAELHKNIVEWFSTDVRSGNGTLLFGTTLVFVVSLVLRRTRAFLPQLAVTLLLWVAALLAVRNLPLFFVVAVPQVALVLQEVWPRLAKVVRFWPVLVLATFGVVWAIGSTVPVRQLWLVNQSTEAYTQARYPVGAAEYLAAHEELKSSTAFNFYGWGGYLLLHVPWFRTFIDGRMPSWESPTEKHTKIMNDYFKPDRLEPGWEDILSLYGINLVIIAPDHKLVGPLSRDADYKEIFRDDQAVIIQKIE